MSLQVPSLSCKVPSLPCDVLSLPCKVLSLFCKVPSLTCKVPSLICKVPSLPELCSDCDLSKLDYCSCLLMVTDNSVIQPNSDSPQHRSTPFAQITAPANRAHLVCSNFTGFLKESSAKLIVYGSQLSYWFCPIITIIIVIVVIILSFRSASSLQSFSPLSPLFIILVTQVFVVVLSAKSCPYGLF